MNNKVCFGGMLCLCLTLGLSACGEKTDASSVDNTVYSVLRTESEFYTIGGTVEATAGTKAVIYLTSNYQAYDITGCTFNGEACEFESDDGERKTYSFVMPSSNVEIKVQNRWIDTSADGRDNFLSFDAENTYTTSLSTGDSSLILRYTTNANFMTIAKKTYLSVNEDILPSEAIDVTDTQASTSNMIVGGKINIDCEKAKVGTTQIVLKLKNDNQSGYEGVIVATVTFTE